MCLTVEIKHSISPKEVIIQFINELLDKNNDSIKKKKKEQGQRIWDIYTSMRMNVSVYKNVCKNNFAYHYTPHLPHMFGFFFFVFHLSPVNLGILEKQVFWNYFYMPFRIYLLIYKYI